MHNALSFPRLHHPKHRVIGFYAPDGPAPPASADEKGSNDLKQKGVGVPAESCVCVPNPRGQYFKSMGQADRWNRMWLLPEEALYLIERGSLDIRWPDSATGSTGKGESEEDLGIPMSLQAAYACFVGTGGLTLERYSVFTGLRRLGYTVIRAPGWDDEREDEQDTVDTEVQHPQQQGLGLTNIFGRFLQWLYSYNSSTRLTTTGPVIGLGIHRSYSKPPLLNHESLLFNMFQPIYTANSPSLSGTTLPNLQQQQHHANKQRHHSASSSMSTNHQPKSANPHPHPPTSESP